MTKEIELLIRKSALKDVELWLQEQYAEIDKELAKLAQLKQQQTRGDNEE